MTYEQFSKEYTEAFKSMMGYALDQAGSKYYMDKMVDLADDYPEHMNRFDEEN